MSSKRNEYSEGKKKDIHIITYYAELSLQSNDLSVIAINVAKDTCPILRKNCLGRRNDH
jgi:hypothetical protein